MQQKAYFNGKRGKELVDVLGEPTKVKGIEGAAVLVRRQNMAELYVHTEDLEFLATPISREVSDAGIELVLAANPAHNGETFPDYLHRVGSDYAESGSDATAEDYREAADRLEAARTALATLAERSDLTDSVKAELIRIQTRIVKR